MTDLERELSFYKAWAEKAASLLTYRDIFIREYFNEEAQTLINHWEHYPPHATGIKQMGEEWLKGEI